MRQRKRGRNEHIFGRCDKRGFRIHADPSSFSKSKNKACVVCLLLGSVAFYICEVKVFVFLTIDSYKCLWLGLRTYTFCSSEASIGNTIQLFIKRKQLDESVKFKKKKDICKILYQQLNHPQISWCLRKSISKSEC